MVIWRNRLVLLLLSFMVVDASGQVAQNMSLIGRWDNDNLPQTSGIAFNEVWGWVDTVANREYAILGSLEYTYFIEVTDPANPVVRDSVAGRYNNCIHRDFKTYGSICYSVADEGASSLQVIDMQYLPDSVHVLIDSDADFKRAHNVFVDVDSGYMYAVGTNTRSNGVITYEVASNPAAPNRILHTGLGQYCHDVYVRNDTAWMSNGNSGLRAYDFNDPNNPQLIGQINNYAQQGYNHSSWLTEDGNFLVMADETWNIPLKIVDVSDPGNMSVISTFKSTLLAPADTASIPHNPFVYGNYVLVSYYHDGMQMWDIRDPYNPVQIAGYDTDTVSTTYAGYKGCWGVYPYLPSGNILVSDVKGGLFVVRPNFAFPYDMDAQGAIAAVTCPGGNDGQISLQASGGTAPYNYAWSNGDTNAVAVNLTAGTYTVTVTDRYGHPFVDTFSVSEPPAFALAPSVSGETCSGNGDGSISLSVSGGNSGYTYAWSSGATTANASGLLAGNYTVTVTDASGCSITDSVAVPLLWQTPVANAGQDTLVCMPQMQLDANSPAVGNGFWSVLGGSGSIANNFQHNSGVSGLGTAGMNSFLWTVTNGPCEDKDTVSVRVASSYLVDAGPDVMLCDIDALITLASDPAPGTGLWSADDPGIQFSSVTVANATVTQLPEGNSELVWTVSDGHCSASDTLAVNRLLSASADFGFSSNLLTLSFSDSSGGSDLQSWAWDFGDGNSSTQQNPVHSFAQDGTYEICLTVSNACGSDTLCQWVQVISTGRAQALQPSFQFWPNPSEGRLNWQASEVVDLRVFSLQGVLLRTLKLPAGYHQVDLQGLASGIYLLEMQIGDWRGQSRLCISR